MNSFKSVYEYLTKDVPKYHKFMYLDGYSINQVYAAYRNSLSNNANENVQPNQLDVSITSERK